MTQPKFDSTEVPTAVILAAGRGTRMNGEPKPLVPVWGQSLVERCMRVCVTVGVRRFVVVVGHRGEEVRTHVGAVAERLGVGVSCVDAKNWAMGNGASTIAAAGSIGNRQFLLLMADHILDPEILRKLLGDPPADGEVCVAIDRDRGEVFDLDDATKISSVDGRVRAIGKALGEWDAIDTGAFLCSPAIFAVLDRVHDSSLYALSHAIADLASNGLVRTVDVTGCRWVDVDTPDALAEAERLLRASLDKGRQDGFVSAWINRPLSTRLSGYLARTNVTPNQITVVSFLTTVIGAMFLALGGYGAQAFGGVLIQAASVMDGCDGEIARLKGLATPRGAWLDTMLDRYADVAVTVAIVAAYARHVPGSLPWIAGVVAATGFILVSYVTKEFSLQYKGAYPHDVIDRLKHRDLRMLVIAVGAIAGFPFESLIAVGLFSHAVVAAVMVRGWGLSPVSAGAPMRQGRPLVPETNAVTLPSVAGPKAEPLLRVP